MPPQVANLTALAVSLSRDPASAVLDEPPRELHDLEQAPPPSTTKIESQQEEIDAKDAVNLKADQGTAGAGEQHGHLPRVPHPPHAEWQPTHAGKRKPFLLSIRSSVYFMMFTVVRLSQLHGAYHEACAADRLVSSRLVSSWDSSPTWLST